MKRSFVLAALCPFLLACAELERPLFLHAQAALAVPAGDAVEVVIAGIPPGYEVEGIVLLDPSGTRYAAEGLILTRRQSGSAVPGALIGIGVTGGSSSGVKPALSLGLGTGIRDETRTSRRMLARVPLADPAAFREHPERWRVEVTYLDVTGARRTLVLPIAGKAHR